MTEQTEFFATCPKGIEGLLVEELASLGAEGCRQTVAGVAFSGTLSVAYRVCLWSRLANRLLMPLAEGPVSAAQALYDCAHSIGWEKYFSVDAGIKVSFVGTNKSIRHTGFGAQRIKDAVVDYFQMHCGQRPSVNLTNPDVMLHGALSKNRVTISLVLSGESLHRRGYRVKQTAAPLKENLAAALLLRSGWPELAPKTGYFLDPMCGSGTLLIEAAMMATDTAPGLIRMFTASNAFSAPGGPGVSDQDQYNIEVLDPEGVGRAVFGFHAWTGHQSELWRAELGQALARHRAGLLASNVVYLGYDAHRGAISASRANVATAGFSDRITVAQQSIESLSAPIVPANQVVADREDSQEKTITGFVITNPPYGERLGDRDALMPLYQRLGVQLKASFAGWRAAVLTSDKQLGGALRLRPKKKNKFMNGTITSELLQFDLVSGDQATLRVEKTGVQSVESLSSGAVMLLNRLRKNEKRLRKWRRANQISCYRLYDADMPEYACAIDFYDGQAHVQEYAAPKHIPESQTAHRFNEVLSAVSCFAQAPIEGIATKVRRRTSGVSQYEKQTETEYRKDREGFFSVKEGDAILQVNLKRYLDTGLFLDHRPLRQRINKVANGKRFLNLFCYTASATVHAALGGAEHSVSLDMSKTYLSWAAENFALNELDQQRHLLVNAECRAWLAQSRDTFDLIMLDPPTFSNSKKMDDVLDIQRDHVALIKDAVARLSAGGILYFSTNLRSFKLSEEALRSFCVFSDITAETLDEDFQRNRKIHQCWQIQALS
jgi:23S rRNA (guanine2445-N2)-methyltransferase / 23S rRNA (guanine2069-N7)-methyltransferase